MNSLRIIVIFLSIALCSCDQTPKKRKVSPAAIQLNDKIVPLVSFLENKDSCLKALSFLDSATIIDSNCFTCYYNKLMFLNSLKQYDKGIIAINNAIRIRPKAYELYLSGGIFYELVEDSINANKYFQNTLDISNRILDTISTKNEFYYMPVMNKALSLILMGDQIKGNALLKELYKKEADKQAKEYILRFINMSKQDIISFWLGREKTAANSALAQVGCDV